MKEFGTHLCRPYELQMILRRAEEYFARKGVIVCQRVLTSAAASHGRVSFAGLHLTGLHLIGLHLIGLLASYRLASCRPASQRHTGMHLSQARTQIASSADKLSNCVPRYILMPHQ